MTDEYPRCLLLGDGSLCVILSGQSVVFFKADEVRDHCTLVGRCTRSGVQCVVTRFWDKFVCTSFLPSFPLNERDVSDCYREHVHAMWPNTGYEGMRHYLPPYRRSW